MKKLILGLSILTACAVIPFAAACGGEEAPSIVENEGTQAIVDPNLGTFNEDKHTVTFNSNGGSAVASKELYHNQYILAPEAPTKAGYAFEGWYYDEDCTRLCEFIYTRMPAENVTFYANWVKLNAINFVTNGGSAVEKLEGLEGTVIDDETIENVVTEKEGYVFDGWFADEELTEEYSFHYYPTEDVTVYAKWHAKATGITITLDNEGATTTLGTNYTEADLVTLSDTVVKATEAGYYYFVGWALDAKGSKMVDFEYEVPAEDVTLYAIFRRDQKFAKVTIESSEYTTGVTFYAERGKKVSVATTSLNEYTGYTDFVNVSALSAKKYLYKGFRTDVNTSFDIAKDVVVGDMTLTLDYYSEGLEFTPFYAYNYNGSVYTFFGEEDLKKAFNTEDLTDVYKVVTKSAYAVTGYTAEGATDVILPESVMLTGDKIFLPVIRIYTEAFKDATFTTVTIPSSVQLIAKNAFENCANLTTVAIPETVIEIQDSAFKGCTSLATIEGAEGVKYLGYKVFEGTPYETALKATAQAGAVYFGDSVLYAYTATLTTKTVLTVSKEGVTTIAGGAFEGVANLASVTLGNEVMYVATGAFKNCTDLKQVTFGANTYLLGDEAFRGCTALEQVLQPTAGRLSRIGEYAFEGCTSLKNFSLGYYVTRLGKGAFMNCTSLEAVGMFMQLGVVNGGLGYLQTQLTSIPESAFENCTSLKTMILLDPVVSIATRAFANCTALTAVRAGYTAASKLASVSVDAFVGCTALKSFLVPKAVASASDCVEIETGAFDAMATSLRIYVIPDYFDVYKTAYTGTMFVNRLVAWPTASPEVVMKEDVEFSTMQGYGVDLVEIIKENFIESATDESTDEAKLVYTITSVTFSNLTIEANEDGTYDLLFVGEYTVTFKVANALGLATENTITFTVVGNEI